MGLQRRVHYSGIGCKPKKNKTTSIETERTGITPAGETPPGTPPASDVFVHQQGLSGRRAAAHRVDPHGVVHGRALLAGAAVRQVGVNLRKASPQ